MIRGALAAAIAAAALAGSAGAARAELWGSSMGELMKNATRIEVVQVDAVHDGKLDGRVVEAVRSTSKPGDAVHFDLVVLPAPAPNDTVLVVCDDLCPRAIGVQAGGAFQLTAWQPMDGAMLYPSVVARASLPALAAGKPAPDLCVRGQIALIDQAHLQAFDAALSPADGTGTGTLDGDPIKTSLGTSFAALGDGITMSLSRGAREGGLQVSADRVAVAADGCLEATFAPLRPLVRTHRSLVAVLGGKPAAAVIARGTLVVPRGAPVKAGTHKLTLSVDDNGELVLVSDLAAGRIDSIDMSRGRLGLGFSGKNGFYPLLRLDFGAAPSAGLGAGFAAVTALHAGHTDVAAVWVTSTGNGMHEAALGTAHLKYVREP